MSDRYQLTEHQMKLSAAVTDYAEKEGLEVGEPIPIKMRDCEDVSKFIDKVQKAHEETGNSELRFKRFDGLIKCLA